jgi:predicted signal transduction protein with EAL and GGDEF domain
LQGDFTFAQYARKGFFELLFVSVINLSVLTIVLTFVKQNTHILKRLIQMMLTILVFSSTVILCSAFIRLGMYEDAYGFTFTRILAHSFMIFLAIVFAFTFVQIWINRLSLSHFMLITALVYYATINTIDLDQLVVSKNINRFKESGKIDINYMNSLSYTGISGLMALYEKDPNIPNLKGTLQQRQEQFNHDKDSWQSFNLKKQQVKQELHNLKLN